MMSEFSAEGPLRSPTVSSAKKRKVDTATRKEYDFEMTELTAWFEKTESALEMLTKDDTSLSPQDKFTVEEQLVLVQVCAFVLYMRMWIVCCEMSDLMF